MRRTLVFILGSMAACTPADDAPATVDAPVVVPPATSCLNPLPTTATPMVLLSGVVTDGSFSGSGNNLDAVTIQASANGVLSTATSELSGIYQLDATTNGKPIDFLTLSKAGYTTTRYFPRAPIAKATSMPKIPVFMAADVAALSTMFGVTQDATKAVAAVILTDCQSATIANAVVTVSPPGSAIVKYLHADSSTTGTTTDGLGIALVFNLPAGDATIGAQAGGQELHEHVVAADPSYLSITALSER